jgi:2-amino-4-hydroxy-6-hydroxymethyldihydropteridine diphosphokinase
MPTACLALGSNLGDRLATLDAAVRRLRAEPGFRVVTVSPWFETAPEQCPQGSGAFLNGCLTLETDRSPFDVMRCLMAIEESFGRVRSIPNSPRTLDLDLLLYDQSVLTDGPLILPHPRMHERSFVMVPLAAIAADAKHPVLHRSVGELARRFPASEPFKRPAPPRDCDGLSVVVTGSTSGIGAAIATAFAERGAAVTTHGRRPRPGRHLRADLRDPAEAARFADECWGDGVDVLVLAAGADILTGEGPTLSFDEKLAALWQVDVASMMTIARSVGAKMKHRQRGCILTIGWDQAETGFPGDSGQLFAAVKSAVMAFTRSLSLELAPHVRVNGIAPGWIRTAWGETASAVWQERVRRETPLGIWGLPEDVADAALWLASTGARFLTGQTIAVNGGVVR